MILMRLNKVLGMCEITPYNKKVLDKGGWFPIDSVNFGFNPKDDSSTESRGGGGGSGGGSGGGRNAGNARSGGGGGSGGGGQGGGGDKDSFTEMSVSKLVDMATVNLMQLAMEARSGATVKKSDLEADIHFIGTVQSGQKQESHTFTFLRIHLETVEISKWEINGTGDERPREEVTLKYERAAMCYQSTPDGRINNPKVMAGWDQTKNEDWKPQTAYFPNFPE